MTKTSTKQHRISRFLTGCLSLLALCSAAVPAHGAVKSVDIGTVASTSSFVPVSLSWQDSWSESVYPESMLTEIPVGSRLKSLAFEGVCTGPVEDMDYSVYVRHTSASSAPDKSAERSDLAGFTCIYDGKLSMASSPDPGVAEHLLAVEATTDFTYEGGGLHVIVTSSSAQTGAALFYTHTISRGSYLALSNDSWENTNRYNYNYVPVMHLDIELPQGYVDMQSVTVGTDDYYDYYSTPLSFVDDHSMSATLYTSDMLGIPADVDIREISYRGSVYIPSYEPHRIRVWMRNTDETAVGTEPPALSAMTQVLDTEITLDSKVGGVGNWTEILKLALDTPFRYTGGNLLVVIQADNEDSQYVYFCSNLEYPGLCIYGTGTSDDMSSFSCFQGELPTTKFYYSKPEVADEPEITFVTSRQPGQKIGFLVSTANGGGIRVDWGGKVSEYPYAGTLTVTHDLVGQEIKVYPINDDDHISEFTCTSASLTSAVLNAPGLRILSLRDNDLESIDLSACPALEALELSGNNFFEFSLESPVLKTLYLKHCSMEQLIITGCTALERLDVSVNSLRYPIWLFWPEAPALRELNISFNQLLEFDLSGYPALTTLICNNNNLSALDLSAVPDLQVLRAGYTGITNLAVEKCPSLRVLDVTGAQLGGMNLSRNTALEELEMRLSGVSSINLASNTALRRLVLSQNTLKQIDLSANTALEHLDLGRNSIGSLDLSPLRKLRYLDCDRNELNSLDLSSNSSLDSVYCALNRLSELPLPESNHIVALDIASNSFQKLPAGLSSLVFLNCSDNKFGSIDIKGMSALKGLDLHSNYLDKEALEALFRQLPDINGTEVSDEDKSWLTVLNYNDNPGTSEVSSVIPETKGWNCSYRPDILGDADAAWQIPADKVWTRFSFAIDTPDEVYYVDWGDGKKVEFRNDNPEFTSNSIVGYACGEIIRVYAPSTTMLGISNAGYLALDVSGMPKLRRLSCAGNSLTSLDVSENTALEELICRDNPLASVTFPEECGLTVLDCSSTLLRSLDLSGTPALQWLAAASCRLESVDLDCVPQLTDLYLGDNNLESIDLSALTRLQSAYLFKNKLSSVDLSANTDLTTLSLDYNELESIDISNLPRVREVYLNNNRLVSVKAECPELSVFLLGSNQLENMDLSGCPALTVVTLNDNKLSSLDLSANRSLIQAFVGDNRLEKLSLASSMPALHVLNAENNALTSIDTKAMPALQELVLTHNSIGGTLDLSANPALTRLDVNHNEIEDFKWGTTSSMNALYAAYNKLSVLAVPGSDLSILDCSRNRLEAVNLSRHTNLFYCVLDFNKLSSISLASNKKLTGLSLRANDLDATALESICAQLPDIGEVAIVPGEESWMGIFYASGNPGAGNADFSAARAKGWTVVSDEEIPVDRILTLSVVDVNGTPVENATLTLMVLGQDVGTQCRETAPGVYTYNPLPVFSSLTYAVRVEKAGFQSQVVDVNGVLGSDLDIEVVLLSDEGSVETITDDYPVVYGGKGEIRFTLPAAAHVTIHDLTGRLIYNGTLPEGTTTIDGLNPGLYIALGRKIQVR